MSPDFHVFMFAEHDGVRVEKDGGDEMEFPSLQEATRHLRSNSTGFVVIHDIDNRGSNRIPLVWPT